MTEIGGAIVGFGRTFEDLNESLTRAFEAIASGAYQSFRLVDGPGGGWRFIPVDLHHPVPLAVGGNAYRRRQRARVKRRKR